MSAYEILERIRSEKPVIHHLTNWVTIYDCANIVKALGASPVMAHAREEAGDMANIASALVLNIGTLTADFIESMKIAATSANKKGIPIVLDVCGAGATKFRDDKCFELLDEVKINVIKGNSSEIARIAGENVFTKGVDAADVNGDLVEIAKKLSIERNAVVVITGKEDIVYGKGKGYIVSNGCEMMSRIVGTGCMATSVIGTFCSVWSDLSEASAYGLACYEIAAEIANENASGIGSFKYSFFDSIYNLKKEEIDRRIKIKTI